MLSCVLCALVLVSLCLLECVIEQITNSPIASGRSCHDITCNFSARNTKLHSVMFDIETRCDICGAVLESEGNLPSMQAGDQENTGRTWYFPRQPVRATYAALMQQGSAVFVRIPCCLPLVLHTTYIHTNATQLHTHYNASRKKITSVCATAHSADRHTCIVSG